MKIDLSFALYNDECSQNQMLVKIRTVLSFTSLMASMILIISFTAGCIPRDSDHSFRIVSENYVYQLDSAETRFDLPKKMEEISGMDYLGDGVLLCVEDEEGILYYYDTDQQKIIREINFKNSGDYEGVAHVGEEAYAIQSDGDLFCISLSGNDETEAKKISTPFKTHNDIEGISPGHKPGEFYIVCKGDPEVGGNKVRGRAIYRYTLENNSPGEIPLINFTSGEFREWLVAHHLQPRRHMPFKPSGIAIHPVSGDIFIIASVGKLLVVMNKEGKCKGMAWLKRGLLSQPEGICFDEEGNLFISSEGRGGTGYILKFGNKAPQDK